MVEAQQFDAPLLDEFSVRKWFIRDDLHPQADRARRHRLPDAAESHQSQCRSENARRGRTNPRALSHLLILPREAATNSEHQSNGVFRHGVMVHAGSRRHDHSATISGGHVDRVKANPRARKHSQLGTFRQNFVWPRLGPGDNRHAVADERDQIGVVVDIDPLRSWHNFKPSVMKNLQVWAIISVESCAKNLGHHENLVAKAEG